MWKQIKGYAHYSISTEGQVRNDKTGTILKHWIDTSGYPSIHLGKDIRRIHKLVAEAFIPNPKNLPEVNHKDGNKLNGHKDNLEWCTHAENVIHSRTLQSKARTTTARKAVLCVETSEVYSSIGEASKAVGRSYMALWKCVHGWTKTCAGLHWRCLYDCESGSDPGGEDYDLFLCKSRWEEYFGVPEEQGAM